MKRMQVLIISPGPHYWLEAMWGWRLAEMSKWAEGALLSTSTDQGTKSIAAFNLDMVDSPNGRGIVVFLKLFIRAIKLARRKKYDLVISYDPLKSGVMAWVASSLSSSALVVEVNGVYNSPYVQLEQSPFKAKLRKWLMSRVMEFTLGRANGIKLLFDAQLDQLKLRGTTTRVVRRYPDIVYSDRFRDIEDRKEILCVGHPFFLKGMDLLVAAFLSICDRYPDWTLKLLGWFENADEVAAVAGGHARVIVHKEVVPDEMPEHIGRCGIFVLPSRTEAMGRVLVEAMAAGKARVGARVDGIPTVIEHEVDGLLFESQDVKALAAALERLIIDPALRAALGRASAERARREFTPDNYIANTKQFYFDVLSATQK